MNDFRELKSPEHGKSGWYIATKMGKISWLTTDGNITRDVSTPAIYLVYHKTEGDAYRAIAKYYSDHGRGYARTGHAMNSQDDIESQLMVFK